ncbi:MAG: hypothetical protein CMM56_10335 [Rhodospirillaceae bacterium]|nr:hypothetical protein [Rhodospirillaceae bacterium]|tara:strand:- start:32 stop:418 length:387 start_codon:yes stop_codon:yes gene_type:complete
MSFDELKLPPPKLIISASSILIICVWLFIDFAIRDPSTILFALIALGSDVLVRNLTSGPFTDRYWFVLVLVQSIFSVIFFLLPAVCFSLFSAKRYKSEIISLVLLIWLVFYLASLVFIFDLRMIISFL